MAGPGRSTGIWSGGRGAKIFGKSNPQDRTYPPFSARVGFEGWGGLSRRAGLSVRASAGRRVTPDLVPVARRARRQRCPALPVPPTASAASQPSAAPRLRRQPRRAAAGPWYWPPTARPVRGLPGDARQPFNGLAGHAAPCGWLSASAAGESSGRTRSKLPCAETSRKKGSRGPTTRPVKIRAPRPKTLVDPQRRCLRPPESGGRGTYGRGCCMGLQ